MNEEITVQTTSDEMSTRVVVHRKGALACLLEISKHSKTPVSFVAYNSGPTKGGWSYKEKARNKRTGECVLFLEVEGGKKDGN